MSEPKIEKEIVKEYINSALEIANEIVIESKYIHIAERNETKEIVVKRMCVMSLVPSIINVMLRHHKK